MRHVDRSAAKLSIPFNGVPLTEKHLAAFCAKEAVIALAKSPGLENVLFRAGPDTSKIAWFLADYPQLQPEDIRACIAYAAEITREGIVPVSVKRFAAGEGSDHGFA